MFKIIERPEFTHTVPVMVPIDGGHREESMKARFRMVDSDAHQMNSTENTKLFLLDAVVSIDDLADAHGAAVPYSDQVRDQLFDLPYVRIALIRAYTLAVTKARVGN